MSHSNSNAPFFVIRTPRLPFTKLLGNPSATEQRQRLMQWLGEQGVVESLYIASPSLVERIDTWKRDPDSRNGQKIEQTLLKYYVRMCSRPTPFGLFSGVHLGHIATSTALLVNGFKPKRRKTRLDMFYLSSLKEHYQHGDSPNLRFYPNSSIYFIGDRCRYIETYHSNGTRQFRLSEIESDDYFSFILTTAENGKTISDLADAFVDRYTGVSKDQVCDYIRGLIAESVLIADMPLPLTGSAPDLSFSQSMANVVGQTPAAHFQNALQNLAAIDRDDKTRIEDYQETKQCLDQLPIKVDEKKLFQVDVYQDFTTCRLDEKLVDQLYSKLLLINALSNPHSNPLADFVFQFNRRFEGQLVPLNVALDDETGIGFSSETGYESSLIAGLHLAGGPPSAKRHRKPVSKLDKAILRALSLPQNRKKSVVTLCSDDLKHLVTEQDKQNALPASFAAFVSLFADNHHQPVLKFNSCTGPSAANLLARFCHLDRELCDKVIQHLKQEENLSPDVIFAEIVHLPDGRPGNVIARPKLRQYEIVFMADSDTEDEYKIPISDLYLWIEESQVKLWSKRLKKRVIPRLSSAHNFTARSLGIYRFLCTLQYQSETVPNISLPTGFDCTHFTPRILIDDLIIHEKSWRIPRKALTDMLNNPDKEGAFEQLKREYQLDDLVCFHRFDNVLHLNLRNEAMLKVLVSETKNHELVELKEALITQYASPVKNASGDMFCNELIIPFLNASAKPYRTHNQGLKNQNEPDATKRKFSPGSEWMSIKLYSGNTSVERFLVDHLTPFLAENSELYAKWFFIRYADPQWHLRIRFNGKPEILYGQLLPKLNALVEPLLVNEDLHTLQLFTYERETERYGGPKIIGLAEELFAAESQLIANALSQLKQHGEEVRWRLLPLITDQLLEMFGYSTAEKLALVTLLRHGFGREFNETGDLRKQLGKKYQTSRQTVIQDLESIEHPDYAHLDVIQKKVFPLVFNWKTTIKPYVSQIGNCLSNMSSFSKDDLLGSLLHMSNNRLFKAYGREHELVMHDFMRRYYLYRSKIDLQKNQTL